MRQGAHREPRSGEPVSHSCAAAKGQVSRAHERFVTFVLRASGSNFNGLVRQYLPKGMCMSTVTQAHCDYIADDLNNRPRKRHAFTTPASLYHRN